MNEEFFRLINENLRNSKEDLHNLFNEFKDKNFIVFPLGDGRSIDAAIISLHRASWFDWVIDRSSPFSGGRNIVEAIENAMKYRKKNMAYIFNISLSGESITPCCESDKVVDAIKNKKLKSEAVKFIDIVSQKEVEPINQTNEVKLINMTKPYSKNIILKGRNKKDRTGEDYLKYGILGDIFEISSMYMLHCFFEALLKKSENFDEFYDRQVEKVESFEKEFEKLKKEETYMQLVDLLQSNKNASIIGYGINEKVAHFAAIRWNHIRNALGSSNISTDPTFYRTNENKIIISKTAESPVAKNETGNTNNFLITTSDQNFPAGTIKIQENDLFYCNAGLLLSCVAVDAAYDLSRKWHTINDEFFLKHHARDKRKSA